jgi:hypothetical protein
MPYHMLLRRTSAGGGHCRAHSRKRQTAAGQWRNNFTIEVQQIGMKAPIILRFHFFENVELSPSI